jgi:type I restriction enzyme S subunit
MLRGSNLSDDVGTKLDERDLVFLDPDLAATFARSTARKGDLVFTCWGSVGQIGLIDTDAKYYEYVVSNKQMKLSPDPQQVDSLFLYYNMSQPSMIFEVQSRAIGSTIPGFNLGQLRALKVEIPGLPEQRAIAEVLGALDDKIAANTKLSNTSVSLLEARFDALGLNRDPGADAEVIGIDELVELNPNVVPPSETEPVYVDMQKLPVSNMSISDWDHRPAKGGARFMNGDTLLARITPCLENRKTGFVDFLDDGQVGIGSTEFIVLRSRPDVPRELSYFIATSERFRTFAIRHMVGTSGRQRVSALDLTGYTVGMPECGALTHFGDTAAPVFRLVKSLTDENRILAATRDALLPQLMSGKLRVQDAEKVLESAGV